MAHEYRLDLLRLFAALLVVVGHLAIFGLHIPSYATTGADRAFGGLAPVGWFGWIGVEIFFVISGYVIAASAVGNGAGRFLTKRAVRVFPALWICSSIALLVRLAWGEPLGPTFASFLRSVVLSPQGPYIDGVVWTLVLEAVFYVLVAGLIFGRDTASQRSRALERGAVVLGSFSAVFLLVCLAVETANPVIGGTPLSELLRRFPFKVALLWHGVFFALGMLLRSIRSNGATRGKLAASVFLAGMCAMEIALKNAGEAGSAAIPIAIWALAVGVIVWPVATGRPRPVGSRNLNWMRQLGLLTYPLYLNHFTLGMYLVPFLAPVIGNRLVLLAMVCMLILGSSILLVLLPEQRLQDWGSRNLLRRKSPTLPVRIG
ncbi:acyltransferase [uncultured Jannaschia sp.]|uniref:acyltransferase family protein n=1 Tax=uncultured Jannaschia sp. TaxID=293347 RepID=UPI00263988CC|nr:acyltransferase [uncultured Jannaschia sp.]